MGLDGGGGSSIVKFIIRSQWNFIFENRPTRAINYSEIFGIFKYYFKEIPS